MEKTINKKRILVITVILIVLLCVGLTTWAVHRTHIIHRISKSISPDGTVKYEIYNRSLTNASNNDKGHIVTIKEYNLTEEESEWSLLSEVEIQGTYISSSWSPNSKLFIINMDDGKESLYLFDNKGKIMRKLDNFFDMQIINTVAFDSDLYHYMLSKNKTLIYELVQWAKDSDMMLIRFTVVEEEKSNNTASSDYQTDNPTKQDGYFWYNYEENIISGLVQTSD